MVFDSQGKYIRSIGKVGQRSAEDYMLMLMPTEELEKLLSLVGEEEQAKILRRVEDDNPCLVKFLF